MKQQDAIHQTAAAGYQSGAERYARGRPEYPPELAIWLRDTLQLAAGKTVVDLGAGTGKFTRRLVDTGAAVIAVEPVPQMLAQLTGALPQVRALQGTAAQIPLADASVDAVVCAQAFHWFAGTAALDEMQRVLKPGGMMGLVWNVRDVSVPWVAQLDALANVHEGDTPRFHTGAWQAAFPHPGFGPLAEAHFAFGHTGSPDDVIVNRVLSSSFIAALPAPAQQEVEQQIRALIDAQPQLAGRAEVTMPYRTVAYAGVRRS